MCVYVKVKVEAAYNERGTSQDGVEERGKGNVVLHGTRPKPEIDVGIGCFSTRSGHPLHDASTAMVTGEMDMGLDGGTGATLEESRSTSRTIPRAPAI